ncbi:MAG TPA: ABC transporter substrate-binding protein [Acetobacteraceae bacterium]|nr:ABC transporter substrate-binding protein [Acetobacteraceae bacterium]
MLCGLSGTIRPDEGTRRAAMTALQQLARITTTAWVISLLVLIPARAKQRVVSLNLCTDQMLVLLAPEQVAALSPLARDPALSFVAAQAARLPVVRATSEAVLRLHPDLVLAGDYGAQTTLDLLEQEGIRVVRLDTPHDFAGIRRQTLRLANLLDVPARGAALIAAMDATLRTLPRPSRRMTALAWEPRGYTEGPDTLMGAVLRAAGLIDIGTGRYVGLEALLRHPPDLLVVPQGSVYPSLATDLLDNPAISSIPRRDIPTPLTICAGPFTAKAASMLAR